MGGVSRRQSPKIGNTQQFSRLPPQLEKIWFFYRKIVIFHTKYPKHFRASFAIEKDMIFWRKFVIFHKKYPNNFRASLHSAQFFKCGPLAWNPGSAPETWQVILNWSHKTRNSSTCRVLVLFYITVWSCIYPYIDAIVSYMPVLF